MTLSEQVDQLLADQDQAATFNEPIDLSALRREVEDATELDLVQFLLTRRSLA